MDFSEQSTSQQSFASMQIMLQSQSLQQHSHGAVSPSDVNDQGLCFRCRARMCIVEKPSRPKQKLAPNLQKPRQNHSLEVRQRAQALRSEGHTPTSIVAMLAAEGHKISPRTVRYWLSKPCIRFPGRPPITSPARLLGKLEALAAETGHVPTVQDFKDKLLEAARETFIANGGDPANFSHQPLHKNTVRNYKKSCNIVEVRAVKPPPHKRPRKRDDREILPVGNPMACLMPGLAFPNGWGSAQMGSTTTVM